MTQPSPQERRTPARRPRLNLPIDNRRQDAGTWAYEHRVGLCVTLIAYLVLMIVFVSSKIVVGRRASTQGMYIDVETLTELEQERDRTRVTNPATWDVHNGAHGCELRIER